MIYATCLNEQQNFNTNGDMLFEMQLLQENLDMSYYLTTRTIINESLEDITAKIKKFIDTIKSFILRLLDTIKAKLNPIITKIKTFFSGGRGGKNIIKNVEIIKPTKLMEDLALAIQIPPFTMTVNINERLTAEEMEERYIEYELHDSKFKSISDITDDDLLTVKHEDINKFDKMVYETRKNTSSIIKTFDNIDKFKKDAERSITNLYESLTGSLMDQDRINIKLNNLKNAATVYGKCCNLFIRATSKYLVNIDKIINMTEHERK